MYTVRILAVAVLCAVTAVIAVGAFGAPPGSAPAGATSPQWQTTASFPPLSQCAALFSCAPSVRPPQQHAPRLAKANFNVPSIVTSNDGGSSWTRARIPNRHFRPHKPSHALQTLSAFAAGGHGILKSWMVVLHGSPLFPTFAALASRAFSATNARLLAVARDRRDAGWPDVDRAIAAYRHKRPIECVVSERHDLRRHRLAQWQSRDIRNPERRHLVDPHRTKRLDSLKPSPVVPPHAVSP